MSVINYSKWDHIELSDDEDDTHPNIDTPSLFRWRHQARLDRMEESKKEKAKFNKDKDVHDKKIQKVKDSMKKVSNEPSDKLKDLKLELTELEKQEAVFKTKEDELNTKERLTPWNVDTLCKDGKNKTVINSYKEPVKRTEEEELEDQRIFTEKYEKEVKKFGLFQRPADSEAFLKNNPHLVCKETANILVIWCVDLKVEEKDRLVKHVAHQTMVMQFILQLALSVEVAPQACVTTFFKRFTAADKKYMDAFEDELSSFLVRIKERADARIQRALEEIEEEEKSKRLGPGGLDPCEVFESLPKRLQECFESKDIGSLQSAMSELPPADMQYHLKRCIDSGMWIPGQEDDDDEEDSTEAEGQSLVAKADQGKAEEEEEEEEEEIYEDPPECLKSEDKTKKSENSSSSS